MFQLVSVLIFIVCLLLILIVLVQNSKGGGLASNFASSNQVMGVRKTTDFLEKGTWILAGSLLVLSILAAAFVDRGEVDVNKSLIQRQIDETPNPMQQPNNYPATAPAEENESK
jgi:preprotein translocase subunit SecG